MSDMMKHPKPFQGAEYFQEIRRRQSADLWLRGPLTYHIQERLRASGCLWWNDGWLAPDKDIQEMFLLVLAEMAREEEKKRFVVAKWHQALFGDLAGQLQKATASELSTAGQLVHRFGDDAADIVVILAEVVKHKWAECVQLITAVRHFLDEAVKIHITRRENRKVAAETVEETMSNRRLDEARQVAIRRWTSMSRKEQAEIEKAVIAADAHLADAVRRHAQGYMSMVRDRCIEVAVNSVRAASRSLITGVVCPIQEG